MRTLLIPILLVALACSSPPTKVDPSPGGTAVERHPPPGRNLLWEIRSPSRVLYLLGSVHIGDPSLYPLSPQIEAAFANSRRLAVEVDIERTPGMAGQEGLLYGLYRDGRSLRDTLSPELFAELDVELRKYGLTALSLAHMKPWFVALMVTNLRYERTTYSAEYGVDRHFLRRARGRMPILELETAALQMNMFNLLSDDLQADFLRETLRDTEGSVDRLETIVNAWRQGDDRTLASFLFDSDPNDRLAQALRKIVFDDRNYAMAEKIEGYLHEGETCFVIVGAGHLLGDTGIVKLLRERGYSTRRL